MLLPTSEFILRCFPAQTKSCYNKTKQASNRASPTRSLLFSQILDTAIASGKKSCSFPHLFSIKERRDRHLIKRPLNEWWLLGLGRTVDFSEFVAFGFTCQGQSLPAVDFGPPSAVQEQRNCLTSCLIGRRWLTASPIVWLRPHCFWITRKLYNE